MKYGIPAVLALLFVLPLSAQDRFFDLTASAVWLDPTGGGELEDLTDPADIDFDGGDIGYGASANIFLGDRISLEIAASVNELESSFRRRRPTGGNVAGNFEIIPITGVLQWHFLPQSAIDPYIGAGAAYVLLEDDASDATLSEIDYEDDAGLVINAGVGIRLGQRFGIVLDGKYVPVEASARVVSGTETAETDVDISPIILSAGLSLRF